MGRQQAWKNTSVEVKKIIESKLNGVQKEVASRSYRASNYLRNASLYVLRGKRSGRMYRVPHTKVKWQASAPGEPPAVRTGAFRLSWGTHARVEKRGNHYYAISAITSNLRVGKWLLGDLLEKGTKKMAPRPYKHAVRDRAMPQIKELYKRPYKV